MTLNIKFILPILGSFMFDHYRPGWLGGLGKNARTFQLAMLVF